MRRRAIASRPSSTHGRGAGRAAGTGDVWTSLAYAAGAARRRSDPLRGTSVDGGTSPLRPRAVPRSPSTCRRVPRTGARARLDRRRCAGAPAPPSGASPAGTSCSRSPRRRRRAASTRRRRGRPAPRPSRPRPGATASRGRDVGGLSIMCPHTSTSCGSASSSWAANRLALRRYTVSSSCGIASSGNNACGRWSSPSESYGRARSK